MWRAVLFIGVVLWSGGATANPIINCALRLPNPDRCIFFIEINSTLQTYYASYTTPFDIVKKVCGGERTLDGRSVTPSEVKVQQPNETQIIAAKYPLGNDGEYFILVGSSDGGSLGKRRDYRIYRFVKKRVYEYSSNDSTGNEKYRAWALDDPATAAYVVCQVDLTPASKPISDKKAEGDATRAVVANEPLQTTPAADEFPDEETYLFYFEQLPRPIIGTIPKTSIECETDAEFVGSNISVIITNANCKRDLKALWINPDKNGRIKRSFEVDDQAVERCSSPKLEFIGVNRTALNFVFHCKNWGCPNNDWSTVAMALLGITIFAEIVIFIPFVWKDFHPTVPDNVEEVVTL